jgi:5-methylcytosine-specific restriction protein A
VFLFTGSSGEQHGYADRFEADGTFKYSGEGQVGDMQMLRGNLAIREHARNGKDLLLFQTFGKSRPIRFLGIFVCAGWTIERQPDTNGNDRAAVVFALVPASTVNDALVEAVPHTPTAALSLTEMRVKAIASATVTSQSPSTAIAAVFTRSQAIRDYVLARSGGRCERCETAAPFTTRNGTPYLEVHHIRRLSDGGPDHPSYVAGLCPNCHREAHHGGSAQDLNRQLLDIVAKLEANPTTH